MGNYNLKRFIDAQNYNDTYKRALEEIKNGNKETHWIWFVFPQVEGLGYSEYSKYYGIKGVGEAKAYIENEVLRDHLLEICEALYKVQTDDILSIMWEVDCYKVRSCITLFDFVAPEYDVFRRLLDKYFRSAYCPKTMDILERVAQE